MTLKFGSKWDFYLPPSADGGIEGDDYLTLKICHPS